MSRTSDQMPAIHPSSADVQGGIEPPRSAESQQPHPPGTEQPNPDTGSRVTDGVGTLAARAANTDPSKTNEFKARRNEWFKTDPNGQVIATHLAEVQEVMKWLAGDAPAPFATQAALQAFKYDRNNPERDYKATFVRAQNAQSRLTELASNMIDHNPHQLGIESTYDIPGVFDKDTGEPTKAKIVGIDVYGRFMVELPDMGNGPVIQKRSFNGIHEDITAAATNVYQPSTVHAVKRSEQPVPTPKPRPRKPIDDGAWG